MALPSSSVSVILSSVMNLSEAKTRIEELSAILRENSRRYYVENAPTMSDFEFDALMRELEDLEKEYPQLRQSDSPTQKVGSDLEEGRNDFVQKAHRYPMLSLGNTYSIGEIEDFAARADKTLTSSFTYCCELKFDGTSISLTYRDGVLVQALTRGDGQKGDDVTANVRHISNIPAKLKGDYPKDFEIRGEILMPYDAFEKLNKERIDNEEAPFANPRNAASGSLKLVDPAMVSHRGLQCTLYHIPAQSVDFDTHDDALKAAESWGLPVSEHRKLCRNIDEIEEYISYWDNERRNLPFATDGIVIKINELSAQRELGYTAKSPRWAVAFKFQAERACTVVESIDYQVGRTGAVTPVANFKPVPLSGSTISRATLNNADYMLQMDVRIGDSVFIEKGGEVIPKIVGVDLEKRHDGCEVPVFPTHCPDCGAQLVKQDGEAKWFCPNYEGCPQQIKGRLLHFLSRKAMYVEGGEAMVDQLFKAGLVKTPADFYDLNAMHMTSLEGWQEKSASKFIQSLAKSREVPFERVLYAIGIRYVGETTAKGLARHFGNIEALEAASKDELLSVPDIGEIIAASVYDFLHKKENIEEIARLKAAGLQFSCEASSSALSDALEGKTIVISGNFSISREEMKELISAHGGKNSGSISGKTSFLLAGTKAGPEKLRKCEELGIPVLDEDAFRSLLPEENNKTEKIEELTLF